MGVKTETVEPEDVSVGSESVAAVMTDMGETDVVEFEGNTTASSILYQCGLQ